MKQVLFLVALVVFVARGVNASQSVRFRIPDSYETGTRDINFPPGAGEFTGDGRVDLVYTRNWSLPSIIVVLPGDGEGFGAPLATSLPSVPKLVTVGDFDEDGALDLLGPAYSGNQNLGQLQLYLGNGQGAFRSGPMLAGAAKSLTCADFDGDGHLDFARDFEGVTVGVQVYRGDGHGGFVLWQTLDNPIWLPVRGLSAVDLDVDGWSDLLYWGGYITARLNAAGSGFGPEVNTPSNGTLDAVADCNLDGLPDAVLHIGHWLGEAPDGMSVALGLGDGSFVQGPECRALLRQGHHYGCVVGDLMGDDGVELLAGDGSAETVLMSVLPGGGLRNEARYLTGALYPMALDLDQDGDLEIAVKNAGTTTLSVTQSQPSGLHAPHAVATGGFGEFVATGDVNGDGRCDVVMTHRLPGLAPAVSVLLGRGRWGLLPPLVAPLTREARALALGDLNGDGHDDLVVGSLPSNGSNLEILLGSSSGQLTHLADLDNGSGVAVYAKSVALADMDRDGDLDLVTSTFGPLSVLLNRGDATFEAPLMSGVGSGAVEAILVEDFDRDQIPDVAAFTWSGTDDDARSRLLLNLGAGGGNLVWAQSLDVDGNHPRAAAGRVDGDAWPDLLVTGTPGFHSGAGGLYHLRNSNGTFVLQYHDATAPGASMAVADLDGDGLIDVATSDHSTRVELRVNDGTGGLMRVLPLTPVASPYDMLAANFVGGPLPDLAVLNSEFNPSTVALFENESLISRSRFRRR